MTSSEVAEMDSWTDGDPVDNSPRGSGNGSPEVAEMDLTTQTHHSDIAVVSVGGSVQDRARDDEWSPSDDRAAVRYWARIAREGITAGKIRFAEEQARLDQQATDRYTARHGQDRDQ